MKNLLETFKKISPQKQKELGAILTLSASNTSQIPDKISTVAGIRLVLHSLNRDEMSVLRTVYEKHDGITVGELEKRLGITGQAMEAITSALSDKSLVCVIKNRQLINNRMDRVSGIRELSPFISVANPGEISQLLSEMYSSFRMKNSTKQAGPVDLHEPEKTLLQNILDEGCLIPLDELANVIPKGGLEKAILSLLNAGKISLVQLMHPEYVDIAILEKNTALAVAASREAPTVKTRGPVNNGFMMLLNCMHAYDIISNYGLFFTRQQEFRKTDLKRVADSMVDIHAVDGTIHPAEYCARLCIHLMYRVGSISAAKENVRISLDSLRKEIDSPAELLQRIIKSLNDQVAMHKSFDMGEEIPRFELVREAVGIISEIGPESFEYFHAVIMTYLLSRAAPDQIIKERKTLRDRSSAVLGFLFMMGITELNEGMISLSSTGMDFADSLLKKTPQEQPVEAQKSIYINPDFTLVIPLREVSPTSLYILLAHTELEKKDVTIHARITKQSIVRAQKRGMALNEFKNVLHSHAKNVVPQNLSFLVQEWYNQTVSLTITRSVVLKASHPSFLDELIGGRHRISDVIRIADHYAIIKKDDLDEVLRVANKKDVIIRLFEDDDED